MVKTDLVYINYIMKEILRLRPSAVFSKIAMKDITLPGVDGKSYRMNNLNLNSIQNDSLHSLFSYQKRSCALF